MIERIKGILINRNNREMTSKRKEAPAALLIRKAKDLSLAGGFCRTFKEGILQFTVFSQNGSEKFRVMLDTRTNDDNEKRDRFWVTRLNPDGSEDDLAVTLVRGSDSSLAHLTSTHSMDGRGESHLRKRKRSQIMKSFLNSSLDAEATLREFDQEKRADEINLYPDSRLQLLHEMFQVPTLPINS